MEPQTKSFRMSNYILSSWLKTAIYTMEKVRIYFFFSPPQSRGFFNLFLFF